MCLAALWCVGRLPAAGAAGAAASAAAGAAGGAAGGIADAKILLASVLGLAGSKNAPPIPSRARTNLCASMLDLAGLKKKQSQAERAQRDRRPVRHAQPMGAFA